MPNVSPRRRAPLQERLATIPQKQSWTPDDAAQADAVFDNAVATWADHGEWTDAEHLWIAHQINIPNDRWRRAVNSVWARSLASKQQRRS